MSSDQMFESSVRSAGDLAGVFEYDGESGYFYLYDLVRGEGQRVVGAIRIASLSPGFDQNDLVIKWDDSERFVGLFIGDTLCAAFSGNGGGKFGGIGETSVPNEVMKAFGMPSDQSP